MITGRSAHKATLLPNGKVLVTGGYNGGTLASAELYDPAAGTFTPTGSMIAVRYHHTSTLLPNGKVLIAGGNDNANGGLASAELYDPALGTFSVTGSMSVARYLPTATLLPNGKVLVAAGSNPGGTMASAELYNPATGTFSATGSMITGGHAQTATLLPIGKDLVAGGFNYNSFLTLARAELYDPTTGAFTATGSMIGPGRYVHTATLLPNGKVLMAGGNAFPVVDFLASAELYDPAAGTFSTTGSMSAGRYTPTATLLPNGKVLVAAGYNSSGPVVIAELYDPAAGTFSATGSLISGRADPTATLLPNGKVLVASGTNDVGVQLASAELYDPSPIVSGVLASPVAINTATTLTANVDDSTTGGSSIASAAYTIDGVGSNPMAAADGAFDEVSEDVTATVAPFAETGVHTLCVRGTDAPGNEGGPACILLPVYDPSGGFVTGGGWINSPADADSANASAAGPATFGFVSKYLPGRSTPDGNLEFQFKAGNLNFKSTSMDWLVVTGQPRAQFRGTGKINGATECKFEVDAWDASYSSSNLDAFGLKIFSCAGGGDRYSLAPSPLTKGSIIIHQ